jgi:anti-sigma factor RsiW
MNCRFCEERMSDYLENALGVAERSAMADHLSACESCAALLNGIREVMVWSQNFPVYDAPPWLATRIIANTPHVVRETWQDTVAAIGRWLIEPRTAMGLLTTVLMFGWLGSLAGISPDIGSFIRNPSAVYYRVYDEAVRSFYRAPVVTEIRSQIERFREIS